MLSIDTLMNEKVVTAAPAERVAAVAAKMAEASVGAVLVLEKERLVGIFSERDLLRRVVAARKDPAAIEVGSVATREVVSVGPKASLRECARLLKEHGVRHLPVAEGGRVLGIISARDFFAAVSSELEGLFERIRYDEQLRQNVDPYDHLGGSYGR